MTVEIKNDRLEEIVKSLRKLARYELYVGIPGTSIRDDGLSNAFLGYIHNYGSPAANIPARPFLEPAIERMKDWAIARMRVAGQAALDGKMAIVDSQFDSLGQQIAAKAKDIIAEGIPPPLKPSTIAARARKHSKGVRYSGGYATWTPLWDTGQLKNSITYVVVIK